MNFQYILRFYKKNSSSSLSLCLFCFLLKASQPDPPPQLQAVPDHGDQPQGKQYL